MMFSSSGAIFPGGRIWTFLGKTRNVVLLAKSRVDSCTMLDQQLGHFEVVVNASCIELQ
jgi:hypothetical protein